MASSLRVRSARTGVMRQAGAHDLAGMAEFGMGAVDVAPAVLQFDQLVLETDERHRELRGLPIAEIVEVEHVAHLLQRKADTLAHQDELQPSPVAPRIHPLEA